MNNLHVRPGLASDRNRFMEVIECKSCGIIGMNTFFRSIFDPCPNCGDRGKQSYSIHIARWEEYKKVEGFKFVWYNPKTWKGQKVTTIGAWVRKETVDGK